ncbi:MAG: sulfatase [Bacteroidota bacterium]
MYRCPVFLLLLFILLTGCEPAAEKPATPDDTLPNIVLIISDDHGWTDFGFMGHEAIQTPHIDALAAESMLYTRGYVPTSVCRPSLATMITGLFPHEHGITGNDPPGGLEEMRDPVKRAMMVEIFKKHKTVSESLAELGYVSHQSGKWWEGAPTEHGFTAGMTHGVVEEGGRHGDEGLKIGREGMQPIFEFIEGAGEQPFFVWYAPFLPHTPHNPPERLLEKYTAPDRSERVAKYYAMVDWFDETVGELLNFLDDNGHRENTLVVFVNDNGWVQAVGDQGMPDTRSKMSPYDAGMRTPLMLRWPGVVEAGRDDQTLVGSIDLAPTMLHAAGIDVPATMRGLNLFESAELEKRKALYGALFAHTAADLNDPVANLKYRYTVREDGWKLILPYLPNEDVTLMIRGQQTAWMTNDVELYNVIDDPYELNNQAAARPGLVAEMTSTLEDWWAVYQ